jgi:hypothetical protein
MTFLTEAKRILSEFVSETKESLRWAKAELLRQYHLSIIKEIKETYPTTYPYIDTVYKIVDRLAQDEDCPDFVEAPEDGFGLPDTYERTNIQNDFAIDDAVFETGAETDAFTFAEKMQELWKNAEVLVYTSSTDIGDGLNEPRYPYDTEPSA